jgi:hypothetical protein
MNQIKNEEKPVGIIILSVFYYIGGFLITVFGIGLLVLGVEASSQLSRFSSLLEIPNTGGLIILISILFLLCGFLNFWIGFGLIKLKNWARITVIVFNILNIIASTIGLIIASKTLVLTTIPFVSFLISIILSLIIIIYLNSIIIKTTFGNSSYNNRINYISDGTEKYDYNNNLNYDGFKLKIVAGDKIGQEFILTQGKNRIGRSDECEVQLFDREKFVSRVHAEIIIKGDEVVLRNLSDTNNTILNNNKIEKGKVKKGDIIKIAKYQLKFY